MICDKCKAEVNALVKVITARYQEGGREIEETEEWCIECITEE